MCKTGKCCGSCGIERKDIAADKTGFKVIPDQKTTFEVPYIKEEQEKIQTFFDEYGKKIDEEWNARVRLCRRILRIDGNDETTLDEFKKIADVEFDAKPDNLTEVEWILLARINRRLEEVNPELESILDEFEKIADEEFKARPLFGQKFPFLPADLVRLNTHQQEENAAAQAVLEKAAAFATGHFVYKSGKHGPAYINKEKFGELGIRNIDFLLRVMVNNAVVIGGLKFQSDTKVRIIGPAYGAVNYAHPVALALSLYFPETTFVLGRTELDKDKKHYLPEKLIEAYGDTDEFVLVDDIVNSGTTCREVNKLFFSIFDMRISKLLAIVSRGGQAENTLMLDDGFYPLFDIKMDQWDPRIPEELEKINILPEINKILGKGKGWVEVFGPGPYPAGTDFSLYSFE